MTNDKLQSAEDVLIQAERENMQTYVVIVEKTDDNFFKKPIKVVSKEGTSVGGFLNQCQLERFLSTLSINLIEHVEEDTQLNGLTKVYRTSKEIQLKTIHSPNQVPKDSKNSELWLLRGIVGGFVVDIYAEVENKLVTLYKPSSTSSHNGFNQSSKKDEPLGEFVKQNGYINRMESSYYQQTRAIMHNKQGRNKLETIINLYNKQNETVGTFRKKEDLEEFCQVAEIEIIDEQQGRDSQGYPFTKFVLSQDIKKEKVEQPPVESIAILRGVVQGRLVDMFLVRTETGLVLQEPSETAEGYVFNEELNPTILLNFYAMKGSLTLKEEKLNRIGNMARLGDMWHEIQGVKKTNEGEAYKLFAKDEWVNEGEIEEFRTKEDVNY
ncbi:hypothetical protein [Bacillus toyonensis]|uniref:hypothetical protein n=1 Tax=Bacillus toyonensis TaxID=155322 RepID=UPI000BF4B83B|nr:hypothetical protein [Bacillus toyonensis]PGF04974.1 hypothetical protein COM61_00605 [Bacillus toyonensis]